MSLTKRDLVLGYNHGYPWRKVAPFIGSLRATGFTGEIGLFTSGVDAATRAEFLAQGVTVLKSSCGTLKTRKKTSKLWAVLRFAPAGLRPGLVRRISQIEVLRYFLYEEHLSRNFPKYRRVLLADIRDVAFQANPFDDVLPPGLHIFEEDGRHTVATRPINAGWVRKAFGSGALEQVGHHPILCAGTILGDASDVGAFLKSFCRTITRSRSLRTTGIDQGIFNMTVRTHRQPRLHLHKNGAASVLTMGIMNPADILLDSKGKVTRANGDVIPVLHQFDRHPGLCQDIKVLSAHDWLGAWHTPPGSRRA